MSILTVEELRAAKQRGESLTFYFFWKGPFSQWARTPFSIGGFTYPTAEHYMMVNKARCFGDFQAERLIFSTESPKDAKAYGRQVKNYDDIRWAAVRQQAVITGNLAKFMQNHKECRALLDTKNAILVEASPRDTIWGIGLEESHPDAVDPLRWPGQNLLGFALMEVRRLLQESPQHQPRDIFQAEILGTFQEKK